VKVKREKMSKDYVERFTTLAKKSIEDQMEFFLKSFIFALGDDWKNLATLAKVFKKYLSDSGEGKDDLNVVQAADFLQKNGFERTAQQRKDEIRDIDLDKNDRIAYIEYLLLHYKSMILKEYYKRTGESPKHTLENNCIGVTGVGDKLMDELFTMPLGLDPELERAIEEFMQQKRARENKLKDLTTKAAAGGVKGTAAANEIKQMDTEDLTQMNKVELTLNAAKKKASKSSGEVALANKKKQEADEEARKKEESRKRLADKAALWNSK